MRFGGLPPGSYTHLHKALNNIKLKMQYSKKNKGILHKQTAKKYV